MIPFERFVFNNSKRRPQEKFTAFNIDQGIYLEVKVGREVALVIVQQNGFSESSTRFAL